MTKRRKELVDLVLEVVRGAEMPAASRKELMKNIRFLFDVADGKFDTPQFRFESTQPWFVAIAAFDFNDREPLAELLRREPVPREYLTAVADIVAGKRKPNIKAGAKLKIPAAERLREGMDLSISASIQKRTQQPESVDRMADRHGIEPIEAKRQLDEFFRRILKDRADSLGVSVETLENLRREFHKRVSRWPVV